MNKKILVGIPFFRQTNADAVALLEENGFELDCNPFHRTYRFEELSPIVGRYAAVISELEIWNKELFSLAGELRIISRNGVGLDNIDLEEAKKRNICVTYARGLNAASVANMTIGLMLAVERKIAFFDRSVRKGEWRSDPGSDLDGKTIGTIGFGQIARETAKRLSGFPVRMVAYDKYIDDRAFEESGVERVDLDDLLKSCDIISIHLPSNQETFHLIGREEFARMKPNAVLINAARGNLVDQDALYEALSSGVIGGAAIDVYEQEPVDPCDRLLGLDNVVLTPHVAGNTEESVQRIGMQLARDIIAFFRGEEPTLRVV